MDAHTRMKHGPSHWCLQAELIRRGGNRRYGKLIPPHEIDGMIRQMREHSKKEEEEKRVSGEVGEVQTNGPLTARQRTEGNPAIPHAPGGFGSFDFAQSESRARKLYYTTDDWEDEKEPEGCEVFELTTDEVTTADPETWYRTQDRKLPSNIEQFVLNWLVQNAALADWDAGINRALGIPISQGTKKMSQTALVELSARRDEEGRRTGDAISNVSWAEVVDMGDVSSQQMSIGGLDFVVLDYGDRLQIPLKVRTLLNEGNAFGGINALSFIWRQGSNGTYRRDKAVSR